MSELVLEFREAQHATSGWDKQTAHQAGATFRLFIEICGDHALGAYTRKDAGRFEEAIERLPADYGKAPRYRGRNRGDLRGPARGRADSPDHAEDGQTALLGALDALGGRPGEG